MTIKLPLFMTAKLKYPVGVAMFSLAYILYQFTNHHLYFSPHELPMTALDSATPFVPWTILIYVSEFVYFATVYITCRNLDNLNKFVYSYLFSLVLACSVFFFWPTTYPRELFPISENSHPFIIGILYWLREQDAATNCFPSLHVCMAYLSAFIFLDEQRSKFYFFLGWGTLISLSTMPTKQHYFIDVIAGFALAVAAYWIFHKRVTYKNIR